MVSAKEKSDFIQSIPESLISSVERQEFLHDLLMRDTNGGKLYKFRAVNFNNIKCLKDGTMYCATPDTFNDPFDSNLGYTFQSMIDALLNPALDSFSRVFEDYCSILSGKLSLNDCPDNEQPMFKAFIDNNAVSSFIKQLQEESYSTEEKKLLIKSNPSCILFLIDALMNHRGLEQYRETISLFLQNLVIEMCNNNLALPNNGEITSNDILQALEIPVGADELDAPIQIVSKYAPDKVNEYQSQKKQIELIEYQLRKSIMSSIRIGCLSTKYSNNLMWSHYADSHKGYCIEYDFSSNDSDTIAKLPFPVVYSSERPKISWEPYIMSSTENTAIAHKDIITGLLTKEKIWEYENEWRIMIKESEDPLFMMPPITCIYLGACINNHNKSWLINIARQKGIPVKQMRIDRGSFELIAQDIE